MQGCAKCQQAQSVMESFEERVRVMRGTDLDASSFPRVSARLRHTNPIFSLKLRQQIIIDEDYPFLFKIVQTPTGHVATSIILAHLTPCHALQCCPFVTPQCQRVVAHSSVDSELYHAGENNYRHESLEVRICIYNSNQLP